MFEITKNSFQKNMNHNSHIENGEIIEDSEHLSWIIDVGDITEEQLQELQNQILTNEKLYYLLTKRIKLLKEQREKAQKLFKDNSEVDTHVLDFKIEELEQLLKASTQ